MLTYTALVLSLNICRHPGKGGPSVTPPRRLPPLPVVEEATERLKLPPGCPFGSEIAAGCCPWKRASSRWSPPSISCTHGETESGKDGILLAACLYIRIGLVTLAWRIGFQGQLLPGLQPHGRNLHAYAQSRGV